MSSSLLLKFLCYCIQRLGHNVHATSLILNLNFVFELGSVPQPLTLPYPPDWLSSFQVLNSMIATPIGCCIDSTVRHQSTESQANTEQYIKASRRVTPWPCCWCKKENEITYINSIKYSRWTSSGQCSKGRVEEHQRFYEEQRVLTSERTTIQGTIGKLNSLYSWQ